jgi:tetratricopeptide (TPR) repeat protein
MKAPFTMALLGLLLMATSSFATLFDEANGQYKAGNFTEAAATYEKILIAEGPRSSVFYNLGNSYQAQKKYGFAILAYERARLLTPRDPDLLANLNLARKAATAFEEPVSYPTLEVVIQYLSRDEWSWLVPCSAAGEGLTKLLLFPQRPRVSSLQQGRSSYGRGVENLAGESSFQKMRPCGFLLLKRLSHSAHQARVKASEWGRKAVISNTPKSHQRICVAGSREKTLRRSCQNEHLAVE